MVGILSLYNHLPFTTVIFPKKFSGVAEHFVRPINHILNFQPLPYRDRGSLWHFRSTRRIAGSIKYIATRFEDRFDMKSIHSESFAAQQSDVGISPVWSLHHGGFSRVTVARAAEHF
jgi:hypothetical protein